jgi:hypothetical protein
VYLYNHLILLNTLLGYFTVNQWVTNFRPVLRRMIYIRDIFQWFIKLSIFRVVTKYSFSTNNLFETITNGKKKRTILS